MNEEVKISAGQLLILLGLSRIFSLLAYAPGNSQYQGKVTFLTTLLSGVLQYLLLGLGVWLCHRKTGDTPLAVPGEPLFWLQSLLYWLFAVAACLFATTSFVDFITAAVYPSRYGWVVAVTFVAAAGLAVCQGIEGLARAGGILGVLALVGGAAILLGLWSQYDLLNFSFSPLSPADMALGSYSGFAMNSELFALLLLLPTTKTAPTSRQRAWWVGGITGVSMVLQLATMLALGHYAGLKTFPVFALVTAAGFQVLQRLDSVFVALWVALGVIKLSVFLTLSAELSAGAFHRRSGKAWVWGNAALVLALAGLCMAGAGWLAPALQLQLVGVPVAMGVLVLPLLGHWAEGRKKHREQQK